MSILNLFKRAPDIKHLGMLQKRKPAAAAKDAAEAGAKPAKQRKDTTKAAAAAHKAEQASEEPATKRRSAGRVAVAKQEPAEGTKKPAKERKAASKAGAAAQSGVAAAELDTMKPSELADHTTYFLIKDEPSDYSIEDLMKEKNHAAEWDGVRNYTARNIMQKMRKGNQVLFYRSGTKDPGVVGVVEVARDPYPDHTSWQLGSKYYDPKSTEEDPRWFMVDVKFKRKLDNFVSLSTMKKYKDTELAGLALLKISRLSVMPVTKAHFDFILKLADEEDAEA